MQDTKILSETEWSVAVRRRLGEEAVFKILRVSAGSLSGEKTGFIGDHFRFQVTVQLLNTEQQVLKFFVKRLPEGNDFRNTFAVSTDSFPKETAFFSRVVQHFRQQVATEQPPWAAECFFTRPHLLVMEDLIDQGFTLFDKNTFMDYDHCRIALETFANLHACSIVLEEKETSRTGKVHKLNEEYYDLTFENLFVNSGRNLTQYWFRSSIKAMTVLLPFLPNYGKHSKFYGKVSEKFSASVEKMFALIQPSDKWRNVICHGDVWNNNIMFRYGEDRQTPEEARLVDFQMYRYSPPAVDIMWFLHITTSRAFRTLHEDRLLRVYHESLSRELERNGLEPDHLLPWPRFLESCRHYRALGRIAAAIYLHLILLPDEVRPDEIVTPSAHKRFLLYDRDNEVLQVFNTNAEYRARMTAALEEIIECDVVKK